MLPRLGLERGSVNQGAQRSACRPRPSLRHKHCRANPEPRFKHPVRFGGLFQCVDLPRFAGHLSSLHEAEQLFGHRKHVRARRGVMNPGSTWHLDEMFATLRGEPYLLWRAVDEHGAELDILLQKRRDKAAAKRFFLRVLRSCPVPRKIVTDQLRSYPAAKADIPELANVKHVFVEAAARLNNRAENSHQPTRERERRMRGFRDRKRTHSSRASARSGSTSPSSGICCALLCTANILLLGSLRGTNSPESPKIRQLLSEPWSCLPQFRRGTGKLTEPDDRLP